MLVTIGTELTVIVTGVEVAGLPVGHTALEVRATVITSPLTGTYEYVALFVPTAAAPLYHWYDGVKPPLTDVAVKLTVMAAQTGLASANIETLTGRKGLTVIVTGAEVAGLPVGHTALEVRATVITSPLTGTYEYVALFVPTANAPLYH